MAAKKKAIKKKPVKKKKPVRPVSVKAALAKLDSRTAVKASAKALPVKAAVSASINPRKHDYRVKGNGFRILVAGIVFAVIAQTIHAIGAGASMGYYFMSEYFPVWSRIMMPAAGAPPVTFYCYSIGFNVITGILFALVFMFFACCIGGSDKVRKGLLYGLGIFMVAGLPFTFTLYLLINLPAGLLAIWAVEGLIINLIGGVAVAHIVR